MAKKKTQSASATPTPQFVASLRVGDRVRIRHSRGQSGKIVEYRGLLGPNRTHVYGVLLGQKPGQHYTELREDQLERLETEE